MQGISGQELWNKTQKLCLKINVYNQPACLKKVFLLMLKIMADKKKLQCQIYADFESLWVNKVSKERKPDGSYSDKCQSRVAFSHDYKLFCVNDTLSKLTKKYISDEAI